MIAQVLSPSNHTGDPEMRGAFGHKPMTVKA